METRTYWIVAETLNGARAVAHAIHAGRITAGERHTSETGANAWADTLQRIHGHRFPVWPIVIEIRTHHDGRIPVARLVEPLADLAATLMLVIGGCWAVGMATLI